MKVKESDLESIKFFHFERGDVTRWSDWDKFKAANPILAAAHTQMIMSRLAFEALIRSLEVGDEQS